ncbi:MAG TPA: hypothetical protein VJ860_10410 [Polyangia bacterium]|jgi:hypothetical protein|nr:hypothetical protein [Polyangia bacterium]
MRQTIADDQPRFLGATGTLGLLLPMLAAACGSGGAGSMDGTWTVVSKTCNGSPVNLGNAVTVLTINGSSGFSTTTVPTASADNCTITIMLTIAYPAAGSTTWTEGTRSCSPANCAYAIWCSGDNPGFQSAGTYAIAGNQATFAMPTASQGDVDCPGGREVVVLQKQ